MLNEKTILLQRALKLVMALFLWDKLVMALFLKLVMALFLWDYIVGINVVRDC